MNNTIYYILAGLLVLYLLIGMANKRTSRKRRSRKFMDDYQRKDRVGRPKESDPVAGKENKE